MQPSAPPNAQSSARRPLKTRDHAWARALARWLATRRVAPNLISLTSLVFAVGGALALLAATVATPGWRVALFVIAAACVQLRLLCNLLDGMVAVEGGLGGPDGALYNELPDRIADPLLIVPVGYACGLPGAIELAWTAALLALLTANIRMLGGSLGLPQGFQGPMAKPHRMAALTAGLLLAALLLPLGLDRGVLLALLVLLVCGTLVTVWRRTRALRHALVTG